LASQSIGAVRRNRRLVHLDTRRPGGRVVDGTGEPPRRSDAKGGEHLAAFVV
jgi:hypothetical protein